MSYRDDVGRGSFSGSGDAGAAPTVPAPGKRARTDGMSRGGEALPDDVRASMEASFGADFGAVRVHQDDQASAVGARAFARGTDLHFAPGTYDPGSAGGRELIGHELAHVVQQASGRASAAQAKGMATLGDPALEAEADVQGARAARGEPVRDGAAPLLDLAPRADVVQCDPDPSADPVTAIHDAFHGSWFDEDEGAALAQIRGKSVDQLRAIVRGYRARYGRPLEEEFRSYCDAGQAAAAHRILWMALSVVDRLSSNLGTFDDNEDGMMDVLRTATRAELDEAGRDGAIHPLLAQLAVAQQYQARRLLWPTRTAEHVRWLLRNAGGILDDDESLVYSGILDLSPAERRALWNERASLLSYMGADELAQVRRMCVGDDGAAVSDASALGVRMEVATDGAGTDDEAVALVVGRVSSLRDEQQRIQATLDTGVTASGAPLDAAERARLEARLRDIGGVSELTSSGRNADGSLDENSFLGRLHDDVGADEYAAMAGTMGGDGYQVAKQRLLDAVGIVNDDEEAIYRAFAELRGTVELPAGRTAADLAPDELADMQREATAALRMRLRNDPDLDPVWAILDDEETATLDAYAAGDRYQMALHELEDAYVRMDTDEAAIIRVLAGMSEDDRRRLRRESPPILRQLLGGGWLAPDEVALVNRVIDTGQVPTEMALNVAMGTDGDGTDEAVVMDTLGRMSDAERRQYRLGYWLDRQGAAAEGEAQAAALAAFRRLSARLRDELDDEDLDAAMERLIGLPSPEDFLAPEGRRMALEIMRHRHRERMAMSGGLTSTFSSTDDTAAQASTVFDAHLDQLLAAGGEISLEDFSVLVGLDAEFNNRFADYAAMSNLVSNIAGTVAATVAAIVIVVLSEGTLAPAAAELIAANGGAALWAAVAGATARVGASEAFGGDFHQTVGAEGARDAVIGAIEGAVAVAASALAARAAVMVGLSGRALNAQIVSAALDSTATGLGVAGRGFARGALEGAIDGFVSGAVGDLVMTATDSETWRRSVWQVLGQLGMSLLRGGAFGMTAGAGMGGGLGGAFAFARVRGIRGPARRTAEAFDSAVTASGGSAEDVPATAIDDIMAALPEAGIDGANPLPGIQRYLAGQLGLDAGALVVEPLGGGLSGAQVFLVRSEGRVLGIFKIFRDQAEMLREISSLRRIADLELSSLEPVGMAALGRTGDAGVGFMRPAEGEFVASTLRSVGGLSGPARADAIARLRRDVERVARAMAELHEAGNSGRLVSDALKDSEIHWLRDRWSRIVAMTTPSGSPAIPPATSDDIEAMLADLFQDFRRADIPATMVHGDAHGGNFSVAPDGHVDTIDVETMWRSVDATGHGTSPQATDAGRFAEWIMTEGAARGLTGDETAAMQRAFLTAYRGAATTSTNGGSFDVALRFYQINLDTIVLRSEIRTLGAAFDPSTSVALQRLLANLRSP
jgi:hypothetical protein